MTSKIQARSWNSFVEICKFSHVHIDFRAYTHDYTNEVFAEFSASIGNTTLYVNVAKHSVTTVIEMIKFARQHNKIIELIRRCTPC
jgi:hypothetical protein